MPDFAMMDFLISTCPPEMLVVEDVRGHACMDYTRKRDWNLWTAFLQQRVDLIQREEAQSEAAPDLQLVQGEQAKSVNGPSDKSVFKACS